MRRCLIRYEFCPFGSSVIGHRHYCFTKTPDLRNGKSPFRLRRRNFEETLSYIQFRLFCAFLYYLGNQTLKRIYLYIYLLFIVYLFFIHLRLLLWLQNLVSHSQLTSAVWKQGALQNSWTLPRSLECLVVLHSVLFKLSPSITLESGKHRNFASEVGILIV